MEFHQRARSRPLLQAVDILRGVKGVRHEALEFGQRTMPRIRLGSRIGSETFVVPGPNEQRIALEPGAARQLFERLLAPVSAVTAECFQTRADAHPGPGENEDPFRCAQ